MNNEVEPDNIDQGVTNESGLLEDAMCSTCQDWLEHRFQIDELIHHLSLLFINAGPNEFDEIANQALLEIGQFAKVDRSYLFLFSEDKKTVSNTHEWCAETVSPQIDLLQSLIVDGPLSAIFQRILKQEIVHIPCVDDLSSDSVDEKEHFESQDIKSLLVVPITAANEVLGFLGFDAVRGLKQWLPHDVGLLELLAAIIGQTLASLDIQKLKRASEEAVLRIIEDMNTMLLVADSNDCNILFSNKAANQVFGNTTGMQCPSYGSCSKRPVFRGDPLVNEQNAAIVQKAANANEFLSDDGHWYHCSDQSIDWNGERDACLVIATDVTEARQACNRLKHSESRLELAQQIAHVGNWEQDLVSGDLSWSDELYRIFGVDQEHFVPSYEAFIGSVYHEDRERVNSICAAALEMNTPYEVVYRINLPSGEIRYVEERGDVIFGEHGEALRSFGTVQDITKRKQDKLAINRLRIENQFLAREAIQYLDNERKHLSRELHDDMGQMITGIKLEADYLKQVISKDVDKEVINSIDELIEVSGELLSLVRSVSEGLYPSMLDRFKLDETLDDLVQSWAKKDRQRNYALISEINDQNIPSETKASIYRIVQESLSNIVHHSQASNIRILIEERTGDDLLRELKPKCDKTLYLAVEDDGIGMDLDHTQKGIGLLGMRERTLMQGGKFDIRSRPGEGLKIEAIFPIVCK